MKKLFVALLVGSMLIGGVASASTLLPQCKPQGGGTGIACTNASVDSVTGNWFITGVIASLAQITNMSSQVYTFFDNAYASITAYASTLSLKGSSILFSRWNGTGACTVNKSLDGSITIWSWYDNNGIKQEAQKLGEVPTQCLTN